jgi:predicted GH43/DUF377 family glycosyl hydrolase
MVKLKRYQNNPIIQPNPKNFWESLATFNPGVVKIKDKIYILYRAMSPHNESVIGLAISSNGYDVEERLDYPVYYPKLPFEMKFNKSNPKNTGCEDPRVSLIDGKIYMVYTSVGERMPYVRIGFTYISINNFLKEKWEKWKLPKLISPPGIDDKDAAILKIRGKYVIFHRLVPNIWIDWFEDLEFKSRPWVVGYEYIKVRPNKWDSDRIGIAGPPIQLNEGFLMIYHGRSKYDGHYRLGVMLLDKEDPVNVISRLDEPILEPKEWYEKAGMVNNVVFSNGHVILNDELFVYYGGADKYVGVATVHLDELLGELIKK